MLRHRRILSICLRIHRYIRVNFLRKCLGRISNNFIRYYGYADWVVFSPNINNLRQYLLHNNL